jgi:hypothetical protein
VRPSLPKTKIVASLGRRVAEPGPSGQFGGPDATFEFGAETAVATKAPDPKFDRQRIVAVVLLGTAIIVAIGAGVYVKDRLSQPAAAAAGSLQIGSDPPGAEVRLNGTPRGTTPLSLSVPAGQYKLSVHSGVNVKEMPVTIANGAATVLHMTWADTTPAAAAEVGSLSVATDPAGARVLVDGEDRGESPLTLRNIPAGQHRVVVRAGGNTYTRNVLVEAGATATLFIGGNTGPATGSIAVSSPVAVQIFEEGRLIGTSDMDRIMLPAGQHDLEIISEAIGYRTNRTIRVAPGQTSSLALELPKAALSINAVPWAEVYIDGVRAGETPLGNLQQTIGPHELLFRHPQLGERKLVTTVTLKETNRISVDMRKR